MLGGEARGMGLFNKHETEHVHFRMREKMFSLGDDYWIEDESGERAFKVDGKAIRARDTFVLKDASGSEVAKIQEHKLSVRDKMKIEMGDRSATVHKALAGIRDRYKVDVDGGPDLSVATVSKSWFRVRDTYGVEIAPGQDDTLLLAVTVCMDSMSDR